MGSEKSKAALQAIVKTQLLLYLRWKTLGCGMTGSSMSFINRFILISGLRVNWRVARMKREGDFQSCEQTIKAAETRVVAWRWWKVVIFQMYSEDCLFLTWQPELSVNLEGQSVEWWRRTKPDWLLQRERRTFSNWKGKQLFGAVLVCG